MGKTVRYFDSEKESNESVPSSSKSKPEKVEKSSSPTRSDDTISSGSRKIKQRVFNVVPSKRPFNPKKQSYGGNSDKWKNKKKKKNIGPDPFPGRVQVDSKVLQKYSRGSGLKDKLDPGPRAVRQKVFLNKDKKITAGLEQSARTEILLTENAGRIEVDEGEHTLQLKQCDIVKMVDIASATKSFHLELNKFGPYKCDYTLNGRYLVLGGERGHLAAFDWVTKQLLCEVGVQESIHDVVWLHNQTLFAAAQKKWTYIYDNQGIEIHCLKSLDRVWSLDFLPYHFLLVAGHDSGFLSWVDVSIGKVVAQFGGRRGCMNLLTTNPANAVTHCGHTNGTVTLWAPSERKPLATVLCHGCPVSSLAVDTTGRLMATGGLDGTVRLWDLRNSYTPLSSVKKGVANHMAFSQTGMLAVAHADRTFIYTQVGQQQKPYLKHVSHGAVSCLDFCPFEDVMGIGTERGFDSILVPGCGEPNYDALERNPFQTKKQRQEAEVKALLEKIPSDLITLDNNSLGDVDTETLEKLRDEKPAYVKKADIKLKHRMKRKNAKASKVKEGLRSELTLKAIKRQGQEEKVKDHDDPETSSGFKSQPTEKPYDPLDRFLKKRRK